MKKVLVLLLLLLSTSCGELFSRTEPDGLWDSMEWVLPNSTFVAQVITVPPEGLTFEAVCTNYDHPWVNSVEVDDTTFYPKNDKKVEAEFGSVRFVDNKLIVTITPNTTHTPRLITVTVTAGDIFDYFIIKQSSAR